MPRVEAIRCMGRRAFLTFPEVAAEPNRGAVPGACGDGDAAAEGANPVVKKSRAARNPGNALLAIGTAILTRECARRRNPYVDNRAIRVETLPVAGAVAVGRERMR